MIAEGIWHDGVSPLRLAVVAWHPLVPTWAGSISYGSSTATVNVLPEKTSSTILMLEMQAVMMERWYEICCQIVGETASQVESLEVMKPAPVRVGINVIGHL